jgi:hypothetical protein
MTRQKKSGQRGSVGAGSPRKAIRTQDNRESYQVLKLLSYEGTKGDEANEEVRGKRAWGVWGDLGIPQERPII